MIDFHKKQFPKHDSTKTPPLRFDRTPALALNTGAHLTVFNTTLETLFSVFIRKLIVKPRALDKAENPANPEARHGEPACHDFQIVRGQRCRRGRGRVGCAGQFKWFFGSFFDDPVVPRLYRRRRDRRGSPAGLEGVPKFWYKVKYPDLLFFSFCMIHQKQCLVIHVTTLWKNVRYFVSNFGKNQLPTLEKNGSDVWKCMLKNTQYKIFKLKIVCSSRNEFYEF